MQSVSAAGGQTRALRSSLNPCSGVSPLHSSSRLHCTPICSTTKRGPVAASLKRVTLQTLLLDQPGKGLGGVRAEGQRLHSESMPCGPRTRCVRIARCKMVGKGSLMKQDLCLTKKRRLQLPEQTFLTRDAKGKRGGSLMLGDKAHQRDSRCQAKCKTCWGVTNRSSHHCKRSGSSRGATGCIQCAEERESRSAEVSLMSEERLPMSAGSGFRPRVAKLLSCCAAILVTSSPLLPAQASLVPPKGGGTSISAQHSQSTPPEADIHSFTAPPLTSVLTTGNNTSFAAVDLSDASSFHSLHLPSHARDQVRDPVSNGSGNLVSIVGDDDQGAESANPKTPNLKVPESKVSADIPSKVAESKKDGLAVDQKAVKNPVNESSLPANSPDLNPEVNANLVLEAWNVVDQVYLDARGKGFDREAWAAKRDEALKHPIRSRIAAYSAIKGLMASLNDPYTRFITPDQFQALSKFDVSGIGLNMGEVDDDDGVTTLRVLGVVHDSSAHAAGIRQNDALLSVGGLSVKGKSAFEATSLIQGPVGQPVTLELQRPTGEIFQAVVPRGKEAQQPVSYKLQKDAEGRPAGYVKLRDFSALAKKGVVEAIQRLGEAGAQSFILDLQDNLGGLVQAGIEIARLFLDEGETVVYTVGRTPETQKNVLAQGPAVFSAPLIVLVNESTASASEIVAGALHDNCRALLVGNKTYGKGLIQSVYELTDGSALAITVGKYITPGHIDIDKYGIEPDFVRAPGPFNMFVPLPSVKEINTKLQSCTPPKIERRNVPSASLLKASAR